MIIVKLFYCRRLQLRTKGFHWISFTACTADFDYRENDKLLLSSIINNTLVRKFLVNFKPPLFSPEKELWGQ